MRYNSNIKKIKKQKRVFRTITFLSVLAVVLTSIMVIYPPEHPDIVLEATTRETASSTEKSTEEATSEPESTTKEAQDRPDETTTKKPDGKKVAFLTFDDGPSENTKKILKILDEKDAVATFFVKKSGYTSSYKAIIDQGSTIGLHTYSHVYSELYASKKAYFDDLEKISDYVEEYADVKSMIVRLPGGSSNTVSEKYCKGIVSAVTKELLERGYAYFDWNVDSGDANGSHVPPETLVENVKKESKGLNTVNILMHDAGAKDTTVEALPDIIDYLRSEGYSFEVLTTESTPIRHHVLN